MRKIFKTNRRGYQLTLEQDLLGDFVLSRRWYGLSNSRNGQKVHLFLDEDSATKQYERIARARLRNGYVLVFGN
jgi:predicted DNA-binding WGR domain protein